MAQTILIIVLTVLLIVAIVSIFLLKRDIAASIDVFKSGIEKSNELSRELIKERMDQIEKRIDDGAKVSDEKVFQLKNTIAEKLDELKGNVSQNLETLRISVNERLETQSERVSQNLETIRATVDEKLEKTLTERLGKSFETVGKQLIEVQKGLGEMQTLAQDVGGLKRVLSNVKMRGGLGEVQLSMLLEQILAPGQYETNVHPKPRSQEVVEFAVKLPGKDDNLDQVWLPIDAKFPRESYEKLQNAYDMADASLVEQAQNQLYKDVRKMAADIRDKYIAPPHTTDFAIMFLPFEGIYAEIVRSATLLQEIQTTYKVVITGPTTLAALLNSLQMGFRTLAIQKRSSQVWSVLAGVKKEFETFGTLLAKAKNNIQLGLDNIEDLQGVRTRKIQSKLKNVETLEENPDDIKLID